jgi:hypothetical protein
MSDSYANLSDLEREFEREMEGVPDGSFEVSYEADDSEREYEYEQDDELSDEFEVAFEQGDDEREYEGALGDGRSDEFVDRLMEIGSRDFETPYEAEAAMSEVLDDIEREYFFGAIKRGLKKRKRE